MNPLLDSSYVGFSLNGPYNPSLFFDDLSNNFFLIYESGIGLFLASADPFNVSDIIVYLEYFWTIFCPICATAD